MFDIDIITWGIPTAISFILTFLFIGYKIKNELLLKRLLDYTHFDSSEKKLSPKKWEMLLQVQMKNQNKKFSLV